MRKLVLVFGAAGLLIMACWTKPSELGTGKIRVLRNLEYVPGGHVRNKLDLYLPRQAGRPGQRFAALPLIIWVHGGVWLEGSKDDCLAAVRWVARKLG